MEHGGPMKAIMKGQVAKLSDADIKALADYMENNLNYFLNIFKYREKSFFYSSSFLYLFCFFLLNFLFYCII